MMFMTLLKVEYFYYQTAVSNFYVIDSVNDVTKGYNSTIFAYGQTGSGKTYTMFGPTWDDNMGY